MATIVNTREVMLQTADYLNTQRAAKSFYTSTQPWTNLFTNADNPAVTNITKTIFSAFLDPFGQSSVKYIPTNTTAAHNINTITLNPTTAFVSGAKVHQIIYVKDDGTGSHRIACRLTTNGTTARTMQYTFSPITGKFTGSSVDTGWTGVTATVTPLQNSWYKIVLSGTFTIVDGQTEVRSSWLLTDNTGATTFLGNNNSGLYLYGFQTYYNVELPETVVGDTWYDAAANTTKIWNGYSFITVGGSTTTYYITSTAPVIKKSAASAVADGVYTNITVTGKKTVGSTTTTYGFLTVTADGDVEATTATANTITTTIASTAGKSSYTVRLYDTANVATAILLDTEVIPVVFDGSNALILNLTNDACIVPSSDAGVVSSYVGTGTSISVYEGATLLTYDGTGTANGTYTITSSAVNVTRGTLGGTGTTTATVGTASGIATGIDTASITYTATGKTKNGVAFTLTATQTFSKSKAGVIGADSTIYYISESTPVVTKDVFDAASSGTYSAITATGTRSVGSVVTNNYGFITLTPNNGTEAATATAGSVTIAATTTTGISSYTAKLYADAAKVTLLDTSTIPVVFKGNTGVDALALSMPNSAHTIPTDSAGANGVYTGSGTELYIYEGTTALAYDAVGTAASSWKILSAVGTNITASTTFTDSGTYATVGQHSAMTADTASILYTVTGKRANGVAFTLTATQTFSKSKAGVIGADSTIYYISESTPVVTKDVFDAASSGTYSAITATGTRSVGSVVTNNYGFITLTPNNGTEAATATAGSVTIAATTTTGISSYTAKLYADAAKVTLLDTSTIPVVFKGNTGVDALALSMPNSAHTIPTDSAGANGVYTGSGTELYIYEGTTALAYDAVGTAASSWKILSAVGTNITASTTFTDSGTYATVGQHSAMTADTASILYTVTGKRANGVAFTLTATQTFSKSKQGTLGNTGDKTATVYLYQWSATDPGAPSGTSSYTWATATHASWSGTGWAIAVGTNPGTPGVKLWVAALAITDVGTATTTTIPASTGIFNWAGATRYAATQNGAAGAEGTKAATAIVYQWALTIPGAPSGSSSIYTWSTGLLDVAPSGWALTPGTSPSAGYTLWGAAMNLIVGATTTSTTITWPNSPSSTSITARGYSGTNGSPGDQGASIRTGYARIANNPTPVATTITKTGDIRPVATDTAWSPLTPFAFAVNWAASDPAPTSTNSLYQTDGIYNPATNQTVWSAPYISALKVGSLSAITVNTGNLTVTGDIDMTATAGNNIRGGQSGYNTGTGFFLGYSAAGSPTPPASYKFSIGDGSDTAKQLTWDGTTLKVPAATITGTLTAGQIAAGAITTDKLLVTSKGNALNDDPGIQDISAWELIGTGTTRLSGTTAPGAAGTNYFSNSTGGSNAAVFSRQIQIDPGKTYLLTANLYAASTNDRIMYIAVNMYNAAGVQVATSPNWGGTYSGYVYSAVPAAGTWTHYGAQFGAGIAGRTIPSNVVSVKVGVLFQYTGSTSVQQAAQDIRLERVNDGSLIVDGSISATKIETNLLKSDNVITRGLTVRDDAGTVIFSSGVPLTSSNITAPAGWLNSNVSISSGGVLSGAGGGTVTLPGVGLNSFRVVAWGNSATTQPVAGGFYNADTGALVYGGVAMYRVVKINRSTGVTTLVGSWNTLAGAPNPANMAAALNAIGNDHIVVVFSYDEPQGNRLTGNLDTAMYRCGASRAVFGSPTFQYRSAYILIGIPGCGEGGGTEAYAGSISADPNAWCDISFAVRNGNIIAGPGKTPTDIVGGFNPISSTNIANYMSSLAIGNGYIANLDAGKLDARTITTDKLVLNGVSANNNTLGTYYDKFIDTGTYITGNIFDFQTNTLGSITTTGTISGPTSTGSDISITFQLNAVFVCPTSYTGVASVRLEPTFSAAIYQGLTLISTEYFNIGSYDVMHRSAVIDTTTLPGRYYNFPRTFCGLLKDVPPGRTIYFRFGGLYARFLNSSGAVVTLVNTNAMNLTVLGSGFVRELKI